MGRRPRSPLAGARRDQLILMRLYIVSANRWAARLGTDEQTLRPHPLEVVDLDDGSMREYSWCTHAFDSARRRALRGLSRKKRARIAQRDFELWGERYDPEGARLRRLLKEVESLRSEVAEIRQVRA